MLKKDNRHAWEREHRVLIRMLLISFAVCLILPLKWSDDKIFMQIVNEKDYLAFLKESARPLTDTATYFFARYPLVWRLVNPFVLTAFAFCLHSVISSKKYTALICVLCTIPAMVLVDAGFMATTCNYLFPVTFGLISLLLIRADNRPVLRFLVAVPLILYATNMQQMGAVLVFLFSGSLLYALIVGRKRDRFFQAEETKRDPEPKVIRFDAYSFWGLLLSCGGVIISYRLNMFGENNRMDRSCRQFFPGFQSLNLFQKAELGFSSTFFELTTRTWQIYVIFVLFLIYLTVAACKRKRNKSSVVTALFALGSALLSGVGYHIGGKPFDLIYRGYTNKVMEKSSYIFAPLADVYYCVMILLVLYTLFSLLERKRFLVSLLYLSIGTGSRILMGFSPTVYASGVRTFFLLITVLILVTAMIHDQLQSKDFPDAAA